MACEVLGVSASGYFEHQRRRAHGRPCQPGGGRVGNEALLAHIRASKADTKGEYGWPRVWKELLARGIRVGKDRVQRIMQAHGIKARDFSPAAPDRDWSGDITYIATDEEGWPAGCTWLR